MRDIGIVTKGMYQGQEVLGVRLSFDKRYITLAPIATLVGLAFILQDPDNLLGRGEEIGITLALVPHDHPGVDIGRRHYPARQAFMNGPVRGKDVFIPMDFLIGGTDYAGQGWRMLMECLSTGPRHFAAGDRFDLDQADAAHHLGLCPGAAAVRHSGRDHGRRGGAARARWSSAPILMRRPPADGVDGRRGAAAGGDFGAAQISHYRSHARQHGRCLRYPWRPRHPGRAEQLSVRRLYGAAGGDHGGRRQYPDAHADDLCAGRAAGASVPLQGNRRRRRTRTASRGSTSSTWPLAGIPSSCCAISLRASCMAFSNGAFASTPNQGPMARMVSEAAPLFAGFRAGGRLDHGVSGRCSSSASRRFRAAWPISWATST